MKQFRIVKRTNSASGKVHYYVEHKVLYLWWSSQWHWSHGGMSDTDASTLSGAEEILAKYKKDYALKKSHFIEEIFPR